MKNNLIIFLILIASICSYAQEDELKSITEFEREAPTLMVNFHAVNSHPLGEMALETKGDNGFGINAGVLIKPLKSKSRFLFGFNFTTAAYSIGSMKTTGQNPNYIIKSGHRVNSFQLVLRYAFPSKYIFKPYADLNYGFNRLVSASTVETIPDPVAHRFSKNQGIGVGGGFYIPISRVISLDMAMNVQMGGEATYSHRNATTLVNGNEVDFGNISSKASFIFLRFGVMKAF